MQSIDPEIWKPVAGYEGSYEVSDLGRVRSLDRVISTGHRRRGMVLRPKRHNDTGHVQVMLSSGGARAYRSVHGLVLEAFVGPRPDGAEGCHCNGSAADNRLANLRWDTHSENERDKTRHGTHQNARHEAPESL